MLLLTASAWTFQDVATIVIACCSAIFSLGSLTVSIFAFRQTAKYYARPHFKMWATPFQQGPGRPALLITYKQLGPLEAHDVKFEIKAPSSRDWKWMGELKVIEAFVESSYFCGLASASDHVVWPGSEYSTSEGQPILGVWKSRISWNDAAIPSKRRSTKVSHRVTKRRIDRGEYQTVG